MFPTSFPLPAVSLWIPVYPSLTAYHQNQEDRGGRVCNSKGYGTFLIPFTPSNRAGWVGCQVTYPQTTGQGQSRVACRKASEAFLKGWFLSTASCRRFCVSACVLGFLLSLRTRKSSRHSKNHPPGGAGDHLPQNSTVVARLGQASVAIIAVRTEASWVLL